jgi:uncharacterized membrane protein
MNKNTAVPGTAPRSGSLGTALESPGLAFGPIPDTVREMVELEQREKVRMTWSDRVADLVTGASGSMLYVWLHVAWFTIWIALNSPVLGVYFDPFPFGLLTTIVSLEAIFLATFVLISQNRQALLSDKRAKLDLQVNLIAEQEVTKLMSLVAEIHDKLGLGSKHDHEVQQMQEPTYLRELADVMEEVERRVDEKAAQGPSSAADTEA